MFMCAFDAFNPIIAHYSPKPIIIDHYSLICIKPNTKIIFALVLAANLLFSIKLIPVPKIIQINRFKGLMPDREGILENFKKTVSRKQK